MSSKNTRGLLIINTGNGKGKTTAGFGQLFRSIGAGLSCAVVQFIKRDISSEVKLLQETFPTVPVEISGLGFTWNSEDLSKDTQAAQEGWEIAKNHLSNSNLDLVLLDELTYPVSYGMIEEEEVLKTLKSRPPHQHVVITGRDATEGLSSLADTVTIMDDSKHHFSNGIGAQYGVEH